MQVNYNLLAVNFFMAITGLYQLSRKASQDFGGKVCCTGLRITGMYACAAEYAAADDLPLMVHHWSASAQSADRLLCAQAALKEA